jgi:L,D-transpeptidase ErfK/SrfK
MSALTKFAILAIATATFTFAADATAPRRIVISIPDRKLVLLEGDKPIKIYDVAVGKAATPTPQGEFQIVNRIPNPTWYWPGKIVGPGKDNPLGSRWMGLNAPGLGIHGTNAPQSVGKAASHGCIRMRKHDIEELFNLVDVGTVVELAGERPQILAAVLAESVTG